MRRLTLLLAASVVAGCQSPMPAADPGKAWVDFAMPTPGGKVLMAERLDKQRMTDGRFFQVTPGSHELTVRFDFEIFGGGQGMDTDPQERLCYMTVRYDHFEAGQRYRLEARSLAFTPSARLINGQGQVVAEERQVNCVP